MKRILALLLSAIMLLTGCGTVQKGSQESASAGNEKATSDAPFDSWQQKTSASNSDKDNYVKPDYQSLNDSNLLPYLENAIYVGLETDLNSDDYRIENVNASYVSQEYLDEAAYNTKSNVFFGYTLDELDKQFQGKPYVFTLGDDGNTTAVPFEDYDDTYDRMVRNVAVGTGAILICITVSAVTGGAGAAPISMIFAASAKTGTTMALSSGVISGAAAGIITGFQTKDFNEALKSAALQGSESFKWGAITGILLGGATESHFIKNATENATSLNPIKTGRLAERKALKKYGGEEQISYLNGEEVAQSTAGATRPDIVRTVDGKLEAIEVKCYNLRDESCVDNLCTELKRQVSERKINLPKGSLQRICLVVKGEKKSGFAVKNAQKMIWQTLSEIYPDIPIDVISL